MIVCQLNLFCLDKWTVTNCKLMFNVCFMQAFQNSRSLHQWYSFKCVCCVFNPGKKKSKFQTFKNFFVKKKRKEGPAPSSESGLKASQSSDDVKTSEPTISHASSDNDCRWGNTVKSLRFVLLYCISILIFSHMLVLHFTNYLWHKLFCPSFKDLRSTWETKPCHMIVSSCLIHTHQRLMRVWGHPKTAFMGKLNLYRYSSLLWFIHISAVKWLIASKISFCLHNICLCTVYIYYVQPKIRKILKLKT